MNWVGGRFDHQIERGTFNEYAFAIPFCYCTVEMRQVVHHIAIDLGKLLFTIQTKQKQTL